MLPIDSWIYRCVKNKVFNQILVLIASENVILLGIIVVLLGNRYVVEQF